MPVIDFEGQQHEFPNDFTEQDISKALSSLRVNEPQEVVDTPELLNAEADRMGATAGAKVNTVGFDTSVSFTLNNEGGYVNDPNDSGGETNFGISKRSYPDENIKEMTRERAIEIYRRDFWNMPKLGKVESESVALKVFDTGVLTGAQRGVLLLQKVLGVKGTGVINDATNSALMKSDDEQILKGYVKELKVYLNDIVKRRPKDKQHLSGWLERADRLPAAQEQDLNDQAQAQGIDLSTFADGVYEDAAGNTVTIKDGRAIQ